MIIDVFSDPICPWCFIGKRRMEKALELNGLTGDVTVRWRAFQLNPGMPPDGMDRADYLALKFGGEERATQIYQMIREAGEGVGIPFEFDRIERTPNTIKAHRLIRFAGRSGLDGEVAEMLFQRYFLEGQDIGEDEVLCEVADACGLDRDATRAWLAGDEEDEEVRKEHDFAVSMNIDGVPCFIVESRYAVVGAQEAEAFGPVFDLVREEERQAAGP
jgi:predicted DsbA family dithiol-disulfide isomerase